MTNQTLVRTTLGILRKPGIWKIGFDLNGLCVTGQRYALVAKAIAEGKISCEVVDKFPVPPGWTNAPLTTVAAQYDAVTNRMLFSREDYGKTGPEQTVILHEATHAMFDLFANTDDDRVLAIDDESVAVLAQALYMRLCDLDDRYTVHSFTMLIDGPGDEALKLADKMIAETGGFERNKRTYFLRPDQTLRLRAAVAREWNFIKDSVSDRTGVQSIYNGVVTCMSCWVQGQPPSMR